MIWLRLKLDLLPIISQEVDKISKDYLGLVEEARKGDKVSFQNLITLQTEIRNRIEEFDKFYEKNYADFRIAYFEKLKLRLRKLLSSNIDVNVFIQEEQRNQSKRNEEKMKSPPVQKSHLKNSSKEKNLPSHPQNNSRPLTSTTPTKQNSASKSNNIKSAQLPNNILPAKKTNDLNSSSKKPGSALITNKQESLPKSQNRNPTPTKKTPQKESPPLSANQVSKKNQILEKQSAGISKPVQKNADEVVFTIKMTKEEYMQYMAAKNKKK